MTTIHGTFTLTLEEDGHLANLELETTEQPLDFLGWAWKAHAVESRLVGMTLSSGNGRAGNFLLIRTPKE